jgi:hypothetical protein
MAVGINPDSHWGKVLWASWSASRSDNVNFASMTV